MSEIKLLTEKVLAFRDVRDWKQFHNSKDLALSLVLEATEVLEIFQWKQDKAAIDGVASERKQDLAWREWPVEKRLEHALVKG